MKRPCAAEEPEGKRCKVNLEPLYKRPNIDLFIGMEPCGKRPCSMAHLLEALSISKKRKPVTSLKKKQTTKKHKRRTNLKTAHKTTSKTTPKTPAKTSPPETKQPDVLDFFPFAEKIRQHMDVLQDELNHLSQFVYLYLCQQRTQTTMYDRSNFNYLDQYCNQLEKIIGSFDGMLSKIHLLQDMAHLEKESGLEIMKLFASHTTV